MDRLEGFWDNIKEFLERFPIICIGAVLFGIAFAVWFNMDEDEADSKDED